MTNHSYSEPTLNYVHQWVYQVRAATFEDDAVSYPSLYRAWQEACAPISQYGTRIRSYQRKRQYTSTSNCMSSVICRGGRLRGSRTCSSMKVVVLEDGAGESGDGKEEIRDRFVHFGFYCILRWRCMVGLNARERQSALRHEVFKL